MTYNVFSGTLNPTHSLDSRTWENIARINYDVCTCELESVHGL